MGNLGHGALAKEEMLKRTCRVRTAMREPPFSFSLSDWRMHMVPLISCHDPEFT